MARTNDRDPRRQGDRRYRGDRPQQQQYRGEQRYQGERRRVYSDDPRYIVDLIERVITVSMKTLEIVSALPKLNEREQPENWPEAWRVDPNASH